MTAAEEEWRGTEEDPSKNDADREEVRRQLRETYGQERGDRLLQEARDYVAKIPRLQKAFSLRGVGDRPDIVLPIVDHVRKLKFL